MIRASGRAPGEEARKARRENAVRRREKTRCELIATLSAGTRDQQELANELMKQYSAERERERTGRVTAEWKAKQARLGRPAPPPIVSWPTE